MVNVVKKRRTLSGIGSALARQTDANAVSIACTPFGGRSVKIIINSAVALCPTSATRLIAVNGEQTCECGHEHKVEGWSNAAVKVPVKWTKQDAKPPL